MEQRTAIFGLRFSNYFVTSAIHYAERLGRSTAQRDHTRRNTTTPWFIPFALKTQERWSHVCAHPILLSRQWQLAMYIRSRIEPFRFVERADICKLLLWYNVTQLRLTISRNHFTSCLHGNFTYNCLNCSIPKRIVLDQRVGIHSQRTSSAASNSDWEKGWAMRNKPDNFRQQCQ